MRNNNREVLRMLAKKSYRDNKGRNRILITTIAFGLLVLCTVFTIAAGRLEAQYLQSVRGSGTAAATYLERGTKKQYEQLKKLSYIKEVGRSKEAGFASLENQFICDIEALDQAAWETMTVPAYTGITGHYPEKAGELMLPVRALEELGITDPEIGMEFTFQVELSLTRTEETTFALCGWYTDYVDPAHDPAKGYVAEEQLKRWGLTLEKPDTLLILQNDTIDGYSVEDRLYEDIKTTDKGQQFIGGATINYSIMNDFFGGYGMAVFCALLILLSVFLLIRNILSISMNKDIRQMGLLNTLGTTVKQIRSIYYRQVGNVLLKGMILGSILAVLMVLVVVPKVLGNLYLYNFGKSAELMMIRPWILWTSAGFMVLVTAIAAGGAIQKSTRLSPVEALHYIGKVSTVANQNKGKEKTRTPQQEIRSMAWRNLLRYRKRFVLTVASLFLGVVVALGAIVLAKGTDYTNSINKRPDFSIGGNITGMSGDEELDISETYDEFSPIAQETARQLQAVKGIKPDETNLVKGAYMDMAIKTEALRPLQEDIRMSDEEWEQYSFPVMTTLQIVDEAILDELKDYVTKNQLNVDMEALRNGEGVVLLHEHLLSPQLTKEADQEVGKPITFLHLPHQEEWEKRMAMSIAGAAKLPAIEEEPETTALAGYLDAQGKGFPSFRRTWHGPTILYFIISEEGFQKLHTTEKLFNIELNVEPDYEPSARIAIEKILQDANRRGIGGGLYVNSKSEELADAKSYIATNRIVMGALSMVLVLMGLLNYFNVLATDLVSRQKEFAIMESVGMTGRQLKQMLIAEGVYYCLLIGGLTATVGTVILKGIEWYMNSRIAYFKFFYPYLPAFLMIAVLAVICIGAPLVMYRKIGRQSVTERISMGTN